MPDNDEVDSTEESNGAADPSSTSKPARDSSASNGSHAVGSEAEDNQEPEGILGTDDVDGDDSEREVGDELVTVGAPAKGRAVSSGDTPAAVRGRQKKGKSTPRQKQAVDKARRTGPVTFLKESASELQKVVYPTGQQLINYFVVVLIFVLFIIAIVSLLDLAFGKAIIAVFS